MITKNWKISNPFDDPELGTTFEVRMKPKRSKSSISNNKRSLSPSISKVTKCVPKQIQTTSHILTPTKSSLMKIKNNKKKLIKSKSSNNLMIKKPSSKKNKKIIEEILSLEEFKEVPAEPEIPQILIKKTSNPKVLEINTEIIENDYNSNINYNPLPVDIIKLDTLNFYSTVFTIKEAISSDLLTGKIYSSSKSIQYSMLKKLVFNKKRIKKPKNTIQAIEICLPDESYQMKFELVQIVKKFVKFKNSEKKKILLLLKTSKKNSKQKINKKNFIRQPRNLSDLSSKIGKMIERVLIKNEHSFQALIENSAEVPELLLNYKPQYIQSQEFLVDLIMCI